MTKPVIQILMIEDNQTDVFLLEEVLCRDAFNSFELTTSERLSTGLEILNKQKVDLILLDLGLPDSQGLGTFVSLHKEFPDIPVVVLTGLMDEGLALEAVQSGAQDYLVKGPASWEIASRAIRHAIERQQSQAALRETNEALQALIHASPIRIVVLDPDGYVKLWSPANERIFGWSESETVGKILPYVPEDRQEEHKQLRQRVLQGEAYTGVEVRRLRKDGSLIDISISTAPLRDGHGNITGIMGLNIDTTERKLAEEKLNQSENRYRMATKATNDVIWEWNAKTHQLMWTENAQAVFGYSPEESGFNEKWWDEHIHPDDREPVLRKLNELIAGDESIWSEEYRFLLNDGSYGHISDHAYVERDADGEPLRMIGAMSNITERKQAEQALYESEERFRSLYNNATIGLYRTTPDGRILMCNPAAVRLLGFDSFDELAKRNLEEEGFEPDYPRQEFHEKMERDGKVVGLESQWTRKDGTTIFVRESATVVRDRQDKILYYDGTFEDITLHKQAEIALRESEEKYRLLFENAPVGGFQSTPAGRYLSANPALASIFLYDSPEE